MSQGDFVKLCHPSLSAIYQARITYELQAQNLIAELVEFGIRKLIFGFGEDFYTRKIHLWIYFIYGRIKYSGQNSGEGAALK